MPRLEPDRAVPLPPSASRRRALLCVLLVALSVLATPLGDAPAAAAGEVYPVPASGTWTVQGRGFGHGRGLSQWGAQGAALQGLGHEQILGFYYPGTHFGAVGSPYIRVQLTSYAGSAIVFGAYGGEQLVATDLATGAQAALPAYSRYLVHVVDSTRMRLAGLTPQGLWQPIPVGGSEFVTGPVDISGASGTWVYNPDLSGAGRQYWGTLRAVRTGPAAAQAVNVLPLDAYLKSVVPAEVPSSWHPEALRAQAVAARSYARSVSVAGGGWDICDTTQCQVYAGRAVVATNGSVTWNEAGSTSAAVDATAGKVVLDSAGAVAFTQFSSSSGGYTVAGGRPYLIAQPDPYSGSAPGDPVSRWQTQLSAATLQQRCPSGGRLTQFEVTSRDGRGDFGGRVTGVRLDCTTGSVAVTGDALRFGMRSTLWQPTNPPPAFGNLEAVDALPGGGIRVAGWAIATQEGVATVTVVPSQGGSLAFDALLDRPDVGAAYPSYGSAHGFDVVVSSPAGSTTLCVYAGGAAGNVQLGCRGVSAGAGAPFGNVEAVRGAPPGNGQPAGAVVSGWAIDPDTSAPIDVHLYRDGVGMAATASLDRPDVGAAYPASGPAHGFSVRVPVPDASTGTICTYAINVPTAANPLLGCRRYATPAGSPIGNLEAVTATSGGLAVRGWAIDPDTADPSEVRLTVDGSRQFVLSANQARPDVGAAYPDYGAAHGYDVVLPTGSGSHQVCVVLVDSGVGDDRPGGCVTATVPSGAPIGSLDAVTAQAGAVRAEGWAIDPDTTAPVNVRVQVDGVASDHVADVARADVGAVFPAFGPNHGFAVDVPVGPGSHTVCVYVVAVPGPPDPWLGCRTVVVP